MSILLIAMKILVCGCRTLLKLLHLLTLKEQWITIYSIIKK